MPFRLQQLAIFLEKTSFSGFFMLKMGFFKGCAVDKPDGLVRLQVGVKPLCKDE